MILMNATESSVFNLECMTHLQFEGNHIHLLSKRKLTCNEEIFQALMTDLYGMIGQMSNLFVMPTGWAFNMDHVEQIEYFDLDVAEDIRPTTAMVRFINGNMMRMNAQDVIAFHQLLEAKAPKRQEMSNLWIPGQRNGKSDTDL